MVAAAGFTPTTESSQGFTYSYRFCLCSLPRVVFSAPLAVFSSQPLLVLWLLSPFPRTLTFVHFCCHLCLVLPCSLRLRHAVFRVLPLHLLARGQRWPGPVFDNKDYRLPLVSFLTTYVTANNSFTCVTCLPFFKGLLKKKHPKPQIPKMKNMLQKPFVAHEA